MDLSGNIIMERGTLKRIIGYLINHYNESKDREYRFMLNYMLTYLKLLNSK